MNDKVKQFILNNLNLINENTKESWEEIYKRLDKTSISTTGKFTEAILESGINDPAIILGYIPLLYLGYSDKLIKYKIPDNVTYIGDSAFTGCYNLTDITIGDGCTAIGAGAFSGCGLTKIFTNNITKIGRSAFHMCNSLKEADLNKVDTIESFAFYWCENLTKITIPNTITNIGKNVFGNCKNLEIIYYKGTKDEAFDLFSLDPLNRNKIYTWKDIFSNYNGKYYIEKIICIDGEIILP